MYLLIFRLGSNSRINSKIQSSQNVIVCHFHSLSLFSIVMNESYPCHCKLAFLVVLDGRADEVEVVIEDEEVSSSAILDFPEGE